MYYYIIALLITLSSSLTWCPMDPALLTPLNAAVTQANSPSFIPQCAGLSLIGCVALYSWYSCNEKAIKLTTLCGALASSYILYKYVNGQEEIKELVTDATNHITQTTIESETRITKNFETLSNQTQQQISHVHLDLVNFKQDVHKKMDASLIEMREQLLEIRKQNDVNKLELEQALETSSTNLEHSATQRYLELSNMIAQKEEESNKLLQESTNHTVTQMQNMFQEFARAQSITLPLQKHTFTPQKLAHFSPPPQVVRRSISQPEINGEQLQSTFVTRQQNINQQFEQTKETLRQKYTQQQTALLEQYTAKQTSLQNASKDLSETEYQHGTLTTPIVLQQVTFDAPQATPFAHKSTLPSSNQTSIRWFNVFALFNLFAR